MDNGKGMDYDKMFKMLSFGFSDKKAVRGHAPVGLYGNGFKSGSMRLGKDAIVFSRKANTMCVGLLSQTYLEKTGAQHVIVPIVMFTKNKETVSAAPEHADSLNDILKYSLFNTKEELLSEFSVIEGLCAGSSGTRIIIWNLHSTPSGELELDFMTDGYDIRIPTDMWKSTTEPNKSQEGSGMSVPKNEYSLRAYCSILYLKPRMQIILQGQKVETLYIPKTLAKVTHDLYKPASFKGAKGIPITFGYNTKSKEHYGLMMYNKNRLIKAYERVACQRKANMGVGVIGVLECNHLTPIHNKQDFDQSVEYRRTIMSVGTKLQDYFKEVNYRHKVNPNCTDSFEDTVKRPDQNWVQCDDCMKWRKLPDGIVPEMLPEKWFCHMNSDPQFRSCEVEEEPDDSDEPARFQKTYKQEEQMQKLQQNRQQPSSSTFSPVQTLPNPSFAIQDTYLSRTPKRKKKAEDLGPENSKEKKARIRDFDDMPDLSTCLPAMFNHDTDANKVDCKDIKASLKYDDDDVIDKDLLKKEKISQTTQSSSDYQQNYKGLHLQIMEAMRHLQDKLIELKKDKARGSGHEDGQVGI
ncbi:MORC family CW-type zinc finger protein 3-like isoform X2 [Silurus meridionalis]|nr:MORC family CW-type zinc finger protein 3-like isoform X2 [Silurus meridionalis]